MRASLVFVLIVTAAPASAHFWLEAPDASFVQTAPYGDPQKTPPCGNEGTPIPTNQVTTVTAGDLLTVRVRETIFHPGHYRVALGLNGPGDLPAAPPVTPVGADPCGSTVVQSPPVFPVIADGELRHSAPFSGPQTFSVRIPSNVSCTNCALQVIQYMSSHGAPCFYYHCANLRVLPRDAGTPDAGAGTDAGAGADAGSGSDAGAGLDAGAGADAGQPTSDAGTSAGSDAGTVRPDGGTDPTQMGGCGCSTGGTGAWLLALALFAGRLLRRSARA